jgi:hypothetical protein
MPLADYTIDNPEGIHYVKILSQLAAINSVILNPTNSSELSFRREPELTELLTKALSHLPSVEAQRRLFLIVSITFHGIADVVRAAATDTEDSVFQDRTKMFEQIVNAIESILSAPARENQHR